MKLKKVRDKINKTIKLNEVLREFAKCMEYMFESILSYS